jgi:hypothetical protein
VGVIQTLLRGRSVRLEALDNAENNRLYCIALAERGDRVAIGQVELLEEAPAPDLNQMKN